MTYDQLREGFETARLPEDACARRVGDGNWLPVLDVLVTWLDCNAMSIAAYSTSHKTSRLRRQSPLRPASAETTTERDPPDDLPLGHPTHSPLERRSAARLTVAVLVWLFTAYCVVIRPWPAGAVFSFALGILIYGRRPPLTSRPEDDQS